MGCFNMRGWQSNLPIRKGDPVFILIMEEREENEGTYDSAPGYRYTPIALPIFGEYNEYGGIKNVVRDYNVGLVESYFNLPIETAISYLDDHLCNREYHKDLKPGITFIMDHAKVYDFFCQTEVSWLSCLRIPRDYKKAIEYCDSRWDDIQEVMKTRDIKILNSLRGPDICLVYPGINKILALGILTENWFGRVYKSDNCLSLYEGDRELFRGMAEEYNKFLRFISALLFLNIHFRPHHSDIQEDRTEQMKEYYKWLIKEL